MSMFAGKSLQFTSPGVSLSRIHSKSKNINSATKKKWKTPRRKKSQRKKSANVLNLISIQSSNPGANKLNRFYASFWWKINKPNTWWARFTVSGVISELELGGDLSRVSMIAVPKLLLGNLCSNFSDCSENCWKVGNFCFLVLAAVGDSKEFIVHT